MKLLLLAPFPPRLDSAHGGGRCVARLLAELSKRRRTGLIYFREALEDPLDPEIRRNCEIAIEVARPGSANTRMRAIRALLSGKPVWTGILENAAFRDAVAQTIRRWRPDAVQAEFLVMAQYLEGISGCARVLRAHDVGVSVASERLSAANGLRRLYLGADLRAWSRYEPLACGWADSIVVFTERDRRELGGGLGHSHIRVIPPDVECPPKPLDPVGVDPPEVLFFGNFAHPPNVDAALRLVQSIFPVVRKSIPGACLRIVGAAPPPGITRFEAPHLSVTGRVDSVEPWLDRAAVVCAPLRTGGGIRIKVMETLAAGKALVASPRALEGIDAVAGDEVAVADTDAEFAGAIVRLLNNSTERRALALGGRRWAERAAAVSHANSFDALYEELTAMRKRQVEAGELAG